MLNSCMAQVQLCALRFFPSPLSLSLSHSLQLEEYVQTLLAESTIDLLLLQVQPKAKARTHFCIQVRISWFK